MKRLQVYESHPVQYHAPVYRAVHDQLRRDGSGEIQVVYATDAPVRGHFDPGFGRTVAWDEPLLEGYPVKILGNERGTPLRSFRSLTGRRIFKEIRDGRPDAVLLTGLAYEFDWVAYLSACALRIPIWLRTETQDRAFTRSPVKNWLRSLAYRAVYLPVSRGLAIGKLNAIHYERHGLCAARLVPSPYCVVDRFSCLSPADRLSIRGSQRGVLGVDPETCLLLFCGKLQSKKNPGLLLEALAQMETEERARYAVVFVGAGELEGELKERAARLDGVQVIFAGFQNQSELAKWYLAADVLVLPSRRMGETWGLVVNEALLAGCRAVLSKHVGCYEDFSALPSVRAFDGTVSGFVDVLRHLPPSSSTASQRDFMKRYSVERAAAGIVAALVTPACPIAPPEQSHFLSSDLNRNIYL